MILKPGTKSGYYGVIPNGKRWRARVYKPSKQKWDDAGTYNNPRDAAIQAAIAQQEVEKGFGYMYSPLKERARTGAYSLRSSCLRVRPNPLSHCQLGERMP